MLWGSWFRSLVVQGNPHHQTPSSRVIRSLGLPWSDSHAAVYTTHPPASALHRPPAPSLSGCNARSSNGEQILWLYVPNSFSISSPTHLISSHAGFVGVLSHSRLSVHTGCSWCPRAREQCVRAQKENERWALPFPPAPPGGACAICLPTALSGCAWPCRKAPQPSLFSPRTPAPAVSSSRDVSPHSLRAPVSPHLRHWPLLLFLWSRHHGLIVYFLYSFSVPHYMMQSVVYCLDLLSWSVSLALRTMPGSSTNIWLNEVADCRFFVSPLP